MSLFRRRKAEDTSPETSAGTTAGGTEEGAAGPTETAATEPTAAAPAYDRVQGPFDASEVDAADDGRVALGGLRLLPRPGIQLRFEGEEENKRILGLTVELDGSAVQLQAYAAPRSEGIWDEIRADIAAGLEARGGSVEHVTGTFGAELLGRLPVRTEDGRTGHQAMRFVGVDGPRWLLRAIFLGPAVHDPAAAQTARELEEVVRDLVVVRGGEAMAPREVIALALPDVVEQPGEAAPPSADDLKPFERGPEISEVR
ncbi:DUF3710 domain-containing protein [Kineococcus gynurae]|uniref:DUF3710 domain-containing protein n=1 Tax=Kineococcus gynurae TaxID=452979 RepID=A0ABV5LV39_9ACTN